MESWTSLSLTLNPFEALGGKHHLDSVVWLPCPRVNLRIPEVVGLEAETRNPTRVRKSLPDLVPISNSTATLTIEPQHHAQKFPHPSLLVVACLAICQATVTGRYHPWISLASRITKKDFHFGHFGFRTFLEYFLRSS